MKTFLTGFFISFFITAAAQAPLRLLIKDAATNTPLQAVSIVAANLHAVSNDSGIAILYHPGNEKLIITFSHTGYLTQKISLMPDTAIHEVWMLPHQKDLEEVTIISSTRNNQRIENSPLKVEVLGKEEMDEENTIKPGNISSILGDVSGIQIQQSSAVTGNANVRIQGLEGRYTQILRDGMPLFDGFSGSFGIMQIPPLDLKQIELIKGSASTLYGGGAIGGLINLISKKPQYGGEHIVTFNQTTLKESNVNVWLSKRNQHIGYTSFIGYTRQGAADVDKDGFSDVAKNNAFIFHPKIFFYPGAGTGITAGYTGTFEKRTGGDMVVITNGKNDIHQFFETNKNIRHTGELALEKSLGNKKKLDIKSSISSFVRTITSNQNYFKGSQLNYFAEASLFIPTEKSSWVMGANVLGERFKKLPSNPVLLSDYTYHTAGVFIQSTLTLPVQTTLEAGLRLDHHNRFGNFVLPRVALFHRFSTQWAARAGIGFGYKVPNPLSVQNTDAPIEKIQPLGNDIKAEKSAGYNAEVNYKFTAGENNIFINQAFFLTQISHPVVGMLQPNGQLSFSNAGKSIVTKGTDTYIQLSVDEWEIYLGYTYTIAQRKYLQQHQWMPLTPRHRAAFTLVKEIEDSWRFGLEGSYTGPQPRDGDSKTPGYLFAAAMVERKFGHKLSVVLNGENLFDYRQSKHETLYTGTVSNPVFKPLWAPIDGRILNFSVRVKW